MNFLNISFLSFLRIIYCPVAHFYELQIIEKKVWSRNTRFTFQISDFSIFTFETRFLDTRFTISDCKRFVKKKEYHEIQFVYQVRFQLTSHHVSSMRLECRENTEPPFVVRPPHYLLGCSSSLDLIRVYVYIRPPVWKNHFAVFHDSP